MNIEYRIEVLGTVFFALALLHSFAVSLFARLALKFPRGSWLKWFFHLLSEVEIVFGFWALLFLLTWCIAESPLKVIEFNSSLNLTEPLFIFCILIMASTRPIMTLGRLVIFSLSQWVHHLTKWPRIHCQVFCLLTLGPLLGSLITEPAAMTVTSLILYRMIDREKISTTLMYSLLGLLFVNISIGGSITHFAAPPILIVARTWHWGLGDVFLHLGIAGLVAVFINTGVFVLLYRKKFSSQLTDLENANYDIPWWITLSHVFLLGAVVAAVHNQRIFLLLFLIFLALTTATKKYHDQLKYREGFLIGFFLAGLVVFGSFQKWWLEPLISNLSDKALFFGATLITAITDNAALTFLGSQVSSIGESSKWALVSGALAGGGLTILANAPNPIGFSILSGFFPDGSLNAWKLLLAAIIPTTVAVVCFLLLGNF